MNEKTIKKITSLSKAKYREKYGLFLVEGPHLIEELFKSNWMTEEVIVSDKVAESAAYDKIIEKIEPQKPKVSIIDEKLFKKLSDAETPQGIMAVVQIPNFDQKEVHSKDNLIIADRISDPGNLGTIIRSAAAFGFDGLITTSGSADIYSPKVIRATQGAIFKIVLLQHQDTLEIISAVKVRHKILALSPHDGEIVNLVQPPKKAALIVGAEISGVDPIFLKAADTLIRIPMTGRVESLNAATAASIAMFEIAQRQVNF